MSEKYLPTDEQMDKISRMASDTHLVIGGAKYDKAVNPLDKSGRLNVTNEQYDEAQQEMEKEHYKDLREAFTDQQIVALNSGLNELLKNPDWSPNTLDGQIISEVLAKIKDAIKFLHNPNPRKLDTTLAEKPRKGKKLY